MAIDPHDEGDEEGQHEGRQPIGLPEVEADAFDNTPDYLRGGSSISGAIEEGEAAEVAAGRGGASARSSGPITQYNPTVGAAGKIYREPLPEVSSAIWDAANMRGLDFHVAGVPGEDPAISRGRALFKIANQESGYNPVIQNGTSAAAGLFQFEPGTWAGTIEGMRKNGILSEMGWDSRDTSFASGAWKDPRLNAAAGAYFTKQNADALERQLGRAPRVDEIYGAHWLGLGGYQKVLHAQPDQSMASLFPNLAQADLKANGFIDKTAGDFVNTSARVMNRDVDSLVAKAAGCPVDSMVASNNMTSTVESGSVSGIIQNASGAVYTFGASQTHGMANAAGSKVTNFAVDGIGQEAIASSIAHNVDALKHGDTAIVGGDGVINNIGSKDLNKIPTQATLLASAKVVATQMQALRDKGVHVIALSPMYAREGGVRGAAFTNAVKEFEPQYRQLMAQVSDGYVDLNKTIEEKGLSRFQGDGMGLHFSDSKPLLSAKVEVPRSAADPVIAMADKPAQVASLVPKELNGAGRHLPLKAEDSQRPAANENTPTPQQQVVGQEFASNTGGTEQMGAGLNANTKPRYLQSDGSMSHSAAPVPKPPGSLSGIG